MTPIKCRYDRKTDTHWPFGSPLAPQRMPEQIRRNFCRISLRVSLPDPPKMSDAAGHALLRVSFLRSDGASMPAITIPTTVESTARQPSHPRSRSSRRPMTSMTSSRVPPCWPAKRSKKCGKSLSPRQSILRVARTTLGRRRLQRYLTN